MDDKDRLDEEELVDGDVAEDTTGDSEESAEQEEGVEELLDRLRRLGADYQNYRKRVQKEIAQAREFANETLLREMLPVLDDMENAMKSVESESDDPLLEGMKLVHDRLADVLGRTGVVRIEAEGQEFDPSLHSAMMQEESDKVKPNTVLRELQAGYTYKTRTLRASMVVVSKAVADEAGEVDDQGDA